MSAAGLLPGSAAKAVHAEIKTSAIWHRSRLCGQHKKRGSSRKSTFINRLALQFQRRQSCFCLDALVAVKIKVRIAGNLYTQC